MIEQFWVFHCGYFTLPQNLLEKDGGWHLTQMPVLAAVALHSSLGPIVIDAPYGYEGPANINWLIGEVLRNTSMTFEEEWAVVTRLEEIGFRLANIDHVLMTHLHHDHTGGMKSLAHATFHISQQEWDYAQQLPPQKALRAGYAPADFRALHSRVQPHKFPDTLKFPQGIDLFGDGSVEMIALPGHTPGHVGFRFTLSNGQRIFHVGDAVFTLNQLYGDKELGLMPRNVATDLRQAQATIQALRNYVKQHPEDMVICTHDVELGQQCRDLPTALFTAVL